ncbi:hypothetical protein A4A49_65754, partial [Nicotiana attenuata]
QVQTSNKFAALEEAGSGDVQGKELAIIEEAATGAAAQTNPKSPVTEKQDTVQQQLQNKGNAARVLNPAALDFNMNSAGIGSTNGGGVANRKGNGKLENKESTAQWVQRAFQGNEVDKLVGINTSCQDIPSQDTLVERDLSNKPEIQTKENLNQKLNEKIQWSGGKLWSEQREIDSDEDEVPIGAQHDEEPMYEDKEEEEQSINDKSINTTTSKDDIIQPKEKNGATEIKDTKGMKEQLPTSGKAGEGRGSDTVDPGGT